MSNVDPNIAGTPIQLNSNDLSALMRGDPKLPSIGNPASGDAAMLQAVNAIKEIVETREGRRGSALDQTVTWRDLFANGLAQFNVNGESFSASSSVGAVSMAVDGALDVTVPPAATGFSATGALASIVLTWDDPGYGNHAYAEVFRAATSSLTDAVSLGTSRSRFYVDSVNGVATYYYWVRFVSTSDIAGPYNATLGTLGQTGTDPAKALALLTGEESSPYFGAFPFIVLNSATTINGVAVPAGVYVGDAFISNGTITNAKIGNAAIDDAKIANLSAAKITAGDIDADRMSANIVAATTGKFSTLSALTSSLGTVTIGSTGFLRTTGATAYATGVGIWMGDDAGTYKFRIGDPAGNRIQWNGTTLTVVGGGTFSGALSAATGTFAGSLSAATGTFAGSLSAATGTFAGSLSAATGTFSGSLSAANGTFSGTLTASAVNAVDTINIAGQAVTIPLSAYTDADAAAFKGSYTTVQQVTITSTGAPIAIISSVYNSFGSALIRLVRDSTVLFQTIDPYPNLWAQFAFSLSDTPGAGSHTYYLQAMQSSSSSASQASLGKRSIVLLETKR